METESGKIHNLIGVCFRPEFEVGMKGFAKYTRIIGGYVWTFEKGE